MSTAISNFWNFLIPISIIVEKIDPKCDYYQILQPGEVYYIFNNEYPQNYSSGIACRWRAESSIKNTKIFLSCEDVKLPSSNNCKQDRLEVSSNNTKKIDEVRNYCGNGAFSFITESNTLNVVLKTTTKSVGGRFLCSITSVMPTIDNSFPVPQSYPQCNCGWKNQRKIVGGHDTQINEYPAMVGVVDQEIRVFCGGTIISPNYILTAAHCVANKNSNELFILVGDYDISTGSDTSSSAIYRVKNYKIFEGYNNQTYDGDIALVYTDKIQFNDDVGPICLPFRYMWESFSEQIVTALGWGLLEFTGAQPDILQEVNLEVISNEDCNNVVEDESINFSKICTFTPGKDSCQSDSGGPLLWENMNNKRLFLVGIISHGIGCGAYSPGINTRVSSFLDWVVRYASTESFCVV